MDEKTMDEIDSGNPATSWALNPWHPMTKPIDLKHLGKLGEEANELGSAINRCIIQGIDECEPITRKPNKQWLQDEIADVLANIELNMEHFELDRDAIAERRLRKMKHLRGWHSMLDPAGNGDVFVEGRWLNADDVRAVADAADVSETIARQVLSALGNVRT